MENYNEAKLISGVEIIPVDEITELLDFLEGKTNVEALCKKAVEMNTPKLENMKIQMKLSIFQM